jgi:hypothetical protein
MVRASILIVLTLAMSVPIACVGELLGGAGPDAGSPDASVDAMGDARLPDGPLPDGPAPDGAPPGVTVCDEAMEASSVSLSCPAGQVIGDVVFASYGSATGGCGSYVTGACHASASTAVVEALCIGRESCTVSATNGYFGDPCGGTTKHLAVEVVCVAPGAVAVGDEPFKGVANSPCAARTALNVSWYYNWTRGESEPCADGRGGAFVPMVWGHPGGEQNATSIANYVAGFVSAGYEHVLAFNEPDNPTQSNISVTTAMALWPSFENPSILIGSPGTAANANPGQAWFTDFMTQLEGRPSRRADFLAIHWYGWNAGSCDANASQLESYIRWAEGFAGGRPIWITEWGCLNLSAPDVATVVRFYRAALAVFARHPRVHRYAWYPWATNCGLNDSDGSLTALGEEYAAAPAYR